MHRIPGAGRGRAGCPILAREAEREPALLLAAIAAAKGDAEQVRRQVVGEPLRMLADDLGPGGADLLLQLAKQRRRRGSSSSSIPPCGSCQPPGAPSAFGRSARRATKTRPVAIEQHRADVRAVGQARPVRHLAAVPRRGGRTRALTGASASPRAASPFAQAAKRSMVTGRTAPARPSALPLSRAMCSSARASPRSRRLTAGSSTTRSTPRPHRLGRVRRAGPGVHIEQPARGPASSSTRPICSDACREALPAERASARRSRRHSLRCGSAPSPAVARSATGGAGQQRLVAGVVQRIALRLHRDRDQELVRRGPRGVEELVGLAGIGGEREREPPGSVRIASSLSASFSAEPRDTRPIRGRWSRGRSAA